MRSGYVFLAFILVATALLYTAGYGLLDNNGSIFVILSNALTVLASAFCVYAAAKLFSSDVFSEVKQKIWLAITVGLFLWLLGEIAWGVQEVFFKISVPYPSVADVFWVLGYPFLIYALLLRVSTLVSSESRLSLFSVGGLLALAIITATLVFAAPGVFSIDFTDLQKTLNLTYAVGNFMLFFGSISIAFLFSGESAQFGTIDVAKAWLLIAVGFALHSIYDIFFGNLVAAGAYSDSSVIGVLYILAYWAIGLGLYYRYCTSAEEPEVEKTGVFSSSF